MQCEVSPSTWRLVNKQPEMPSGSTELDDVMRQLWTVSDFKESEQRAHKLTLPSPRSCVLCAQHITERQMPRIIVAALYKKYCSNMKHYYIKEIDRFIDDEFHPQTLKFAEISLLSKKKECLSRTYKADEFERKFEMLWKFHQFAKCRPGMFGKGTYDILCYNYYEKRRLHERAIRKMLDKLTNSELQDDGVELERFMKESQFIEEKPRGSTSRLLDEEAIQPLKLLSGENLKRALLNTVSRQAQENSRKYSLSYQFNQCSVEEAHKMIPVNLEKLAMPSFFNKSYIPHWQNDPKKQPFQTNEISISAVSIKENICPNLSTQCGMTTHTAHVSLGIGTHINEPCMITESTDFLVNHMKKNAEPKVVSATARDKTRLTSFMSSREGLPPSRPGKNLRIAVAAHEKLDLQQFRAPSSIKGKKKSTKDKDKVVSKKKFNVTDIEKFLKCQLRTPMDAASSLHNRQTSKEKHGDHLTATRENTKKREKRSITKDKSRESKGYFVAKTYGQPKARRGTSGSAHNSKDKCSRFAQTASQLNLGLTHEQKMKTTNFMETRSFQTCKAPPSFMSTRRLFEDKTINESSKRKSKDRVGLTSSVSTSRMMLGESTGRLFFAKDIDRGKDSVRVSKLISPKGQSNIEKLLLSTQRIPSVKLFRPTKADVYDNFEKFRRTSANKSGLGDTTKQSIICPRPKKKKDNCNMAKKSKSKTKKSRNDPMKASLASLSLSKDCIFMARQSRSRGATQTTDDPPLPKKPLAALLKRAIPKH